MSCFEGLNEKLLRAIPPSKKVLEFGCATGRLGGRYKELAPSACWHGVDGHAPSLEVAERCLDRVWLADLDGVDVMAFEEGYDCVVMGDVLENLKQPERLLAALRAHVTADARLVCSVPNMTNISIIERMLVGDLSYDANGLMDRTHLRFFSQISAFKVFLDSGWLPDLKDQYVAGNPNEGWAVDLISCANKLGVSKETASRALQCYQMIIVCARSEDTKSRTTLPLSVIVPVNNETQFALNVARSPGLQEIDAQIIPCRGAKSAADAFERGRVQATGQWLMFCHQDVYFPAGSGFSLCERLAEFPQDAAKRAVIGFAGIGTLSPADPYAHTFNAGLVIDRTRHYDWPIAERSCSLDEFAVVLNRNTDSAIDPALGWHLWATDLCLATMCRDPPAFAQIVRVPIYHNSFSDHSLPPAFYDSAKKLVAKYPQVSGIRTLCGQIC
jgi:hypothetical protein